MAFSGQSSWQHRHTMHFLRFILALPSLISMAPTGQLLAQNPHPVHFPPAEGTVFTNALASAPANPGTKS
ncbi:MAG: hypothetical protein AO394_02755 [Candidatus Fermentibacter daniensis]|nr:MAG: hypothetical protein AO394_02755 [Candidatus Fermentibacter daniensis]